MNSHYVAFVHKHLGEEDKDAWILFNDEKVVKAVDVDEMKKLVTFLAPHIPLRPVLVFHFQDFTELERSGLPMFTSLKGCNNVCIRPCV